MKTTDHLLVSLRKNDRTAPWIITTLNDEGSLFRYSIGKNGKSSAGPKLNKILNDIDSKEKRYPYEYGMNMVSDSLKRTAIINYMGEVISFTEITLATYKFIASDVSQKPMITPDSKISIDSDLVISESSATPMNMSMMMRSSYTEDVNFAPTVNSRSANTEEYTVGSINKYWVFLQPNSINIVDGDTIDGNIVGYGWPKEEEIPNQIGNVNFRIGSKIRIRYLGIDCFETKKTGDAAKYADKENYTSAKRYAVSLDDIYDCAEEAKVKNDELIRRDKVVAISLQWDVNSKTVLLDSTQTRIVGVVFSTQYNTVKDAQYAASDDKFVGLNVNKELLRSYYSKNEELKKKYPKSLALPLAEYDDGRKYANNPGITTAGWKEELGINSPPDLETIKWKDDKDDGKDDGGYKDDKELEKEIEKQIDKKTDVTKDKNTQTKVDISIDGFINNTTDYVVPYDDRLVNQKLYNVKSTLTDDMPYDYTNRVRIGDVMLDIPPLSIQMTRQNQNEKVKVMRSKSSLQKQVGTSRVLLTLELYLHNLESINGYEEKAYGNKKYFMDGLRPLIAQFKKAPFLPIDNEYINESLDIHNVALRNIQVSTVPNFPESLMATLVLEKFDAQPYLMTSDKLGDICNYPLLRWNYQHILQEPTANEEPWKDYLPPVKRLDNRFSFSIIDEGELMYRDSLIKEFRNMKTPNQQKKEKNDVKKEDGQKYEDSKRVKKVLNQMENFQKLLGSQKKKDVQLVTFYPSKKDKEEQDRAKNAIKVYGESEQYKGKSNDPYVIRKGYGQEKDYSAFIPEFLREYRYEFSGGQKTAFDELNSDFKKVTTTDGLTVPEYVSKFNDIGIGQIAFTHKPYAKMFAEFETSIQRSDGSYQCLIPLTDKYGLSGGDNKFLKIITELKKIANYKERHENNNKDYKNKYNYLSAQIDKTEEDTKMMEWEIEDMIPISLNVAMENVFTSVQVQKAETPTLQYMGGQDPYVQLEFETDSHGVLQTEAMMNKVAEYVRNYRESLVSGFIQIKNPLVNMFGIKYVLPETIKYDTVPNFPDRKRVTLILSGFDKTQRRQEALYGFTGGNPNENMKDRAFGTYRPEKDNFYITEKMKNQELYPDLQVPSVAELEDFLKTSKIDTQIVKWENRTGQVYLDPDFYFSSKYTYRKILKEIVDGGEGIEFQWYDMTGMAGYSSTKGAGPIDMMDKNSDESKSQIEDDVNNIDPNFEWKADIFGDISEKSSKDKEEETEKASKTKLIEPPTIKNVAIANYFTKDSKTGKAPYQTVPSYDNWKKWTYNSEKTKKDYDNWKKTLKELKEEDVWHYLAKAVLNTFSDLAVAKDELEVIKTFLPKYTVNLEKEYVNKKGNLLGKYSISSSEFVYAVMYELCDGKAMPNGVEPKKEAKDPKEWKKARLAGTPGYTFQRMFGYIKAILSLESKWQHFDNSGIPKTSNLNKDKLPTRVGISGVDISRIGDVRQAEEVTWGWKRNIDYALNSMNSYYKKAMSSPYKEIKARAIDWTIASHSGVDMPSCLEKGEKGEPDENYLDNKISPNSVGYYNKVDTLFYSLYKLYTKDIAGYIYTAPHGSVIEKARFAYASDVDLNNVSGGGLLQGPSKVIPDKNGEIKSTSDPKKKQKEILDNLLVNTWDTELQFKSMFTDMLQTDHQGRMLRAFPTFSLYIIDEGKFFNKFNVWDNFYGYNAILSIDVYKSRKMIADTAIIEMSNMYGGLSTKRKDMEFDDLNLPSFFSSVFWNQYVMDKPVDEMLDAKKDVYKSMMLQTGARVHLRMGYGSDVRYLPTIFNGTIAELNTGDVIEMVCQGDGLELTNVISGSPDDENKSLFNTVEPSNMMGKLLSSKGSWMKDFLNRNTGGEFFKDNANGVVHFGSPFLAPDGTTNFMNEDYGEATQNIYSQNGTGSMTQWKTAKGENINKFSSLMNWNFLNPFGDDTANFSRIAAENDEDNILLNLYNQTIWDIIATYSLATQDYIAAVVPFEFRSTIFFGKPNWPYEHKYDSEYKFDTKTKNWQRSITNTHKKTFMQAHIYNSSTCILHNNIKASEEGMFTNVIVSYDGYAAPIVQADNDIRLDKQKTTVVEANLVSRWGPKSGIGKGFGKNFHTTEAQSQAYGHSTVRDFMKDMYKGELYVFGDPSVKPHDVVYLQDDIVDMNGIHLVKAVHHSMNMETGFTSVIEPDAYVTNFNYEFLFMADKIYATGKNLTAQVLTFSFAAGLGYFGSSAVNKLIKSVVFETSSLIKTIGGSKVMNKASEKIFSHQMTKLAPYLGEYALKNVSKDLASAKTLAEKAKVFENITELLKVTKADIKEAKSAAKASRSLLGKFAGKELVVEGAETVAKNMSSAYRTGKTLEAGAKVAKGSKSLGSFAKSTVGVITKFNPISILISGAFEIATASLGETWLRKKQDSECVKIFPLKYKGQSFTAGINGHRGAVYGDTPSVGDKIMKSEWGQGKDADVDGSLVTWVCKSFNFFSPSDPNEKTKKE